MTTKTNRYDIKPMFRGVALMVVVFFCLFGATGTLAITCLWHLPILYGIVYCIMGFSLIRIVSNIFNRSLSVSLFALKRSLVSFISNLTINFTAGTLMTNLTMARIPISPRPILVKFRNLFNFLAHITSFRYNCFRHGFFLSKKLCFEPLQTRCLCGFLYFTPKSSQSQILFERIYEQ